VTIEHVIFIPGVLLVGLTIGYALGAKAVRAELQRLKRRAKE
jgi:proteasome assembly chaperone (PAC2) family protein